MKYASDAVVNLLGHVIIDDNCKILTYTNEKYPGYVHNALIVSPHNEAKVFIKHNNIPIAGIFNYKGMSSIIYLKSDQNATEPGAYD